MFKTSDAPRAAPHPRAPGIDVHCHPGSFPCHWPVQGEEFWEDGLKSGKIMRHSTRNRKSAAFPTEVFTNLYLADGHGAD